MTIPGGENRKISEPSTALDKIGILKLGVSCDDEIIRTVGGYLDVPGRKLGSMVRIIGLFHLLINGVYWG